MAQTGYTPIQLYLSSTAAAVPLAANLAAGELAINTVDGKLYYKSNAGVVTLLASSTTVTNSFSAGTTGLTPNTATTGAVTLAGTLVVGNGGTGQTTLATGALGYGQGASAHASLAIGTAGQILTVNSGATAPQWTTLTGVAVTTFSAGTTGFTPSSATSGAVTLAGTLATTNGGTGLTSFTSGGVVYASSSSALATGSALTWNGSTLAVTGDIKASQGSKVGVARADGAIVSYIANVSDTETQWRSDGGGSFSTFYIAGSEGMRLSSTGLTVKYANPSSGGATFALNTTTPTEYFDINTNDDYGSFTAALGGSPFLILKYSGGNLSAKTTLVSGDQQAIIFQGYDGTNYCNMSSITTYAASTVSSGVVPGRLQFSTSASSSVVPAFHIDQNQYCTIGSATVGNVPLYISKAAVNNYEAAIYVYPSAAPSNSSHILFNSSGSGAAIFGRTNSAGVIQGFTSGSNYSTVLGNTGALPLYLITNNTHAMNISSGQLVAISNLGTTANAPLSVLTPASSASGYMFEVNPSTSSNASVLYINNSGAGSLYLGRASSTGAGAPVAMNAGESFMIHSGTQNLVLGGNNLRALLIDSSGYVTTPYQVSFNAYASASLSGAQTPVVFNSTRHNKGSGYSTSTGRFTAPVDGTYFFSVTNNVQNANNIDGVIRKNGTAIIGVEYDYANSSLWMGLTVTTILELVAGDYVDYTVGAGSAVTVEGNPWNTFVGYLLG